MISDDRDPEEQLEDLRDTAREASEDLIPILMEKAINGRTRDTLAIFEALADRGGFYKQAPPPPQQIQQQPLINLNFNQAEMSQVLSGLKTITEHSAVTDTADQKEKENN